MDKLEIKIIGFTALVLSAFLISLMIAMGKKNMDVPACIPYNTAFSKPHLKQIDSTTYEAFMVAKMWSFEPSEMYIPVGSDVDFYLTSNDVVHGFHINSKALNMMAVPGAINKQTVHFDKPGVYKIVCHEYCGTGHQNMQAEIIVNYKTKPKN
ncbi:MAG: hypothetical protein RL708_864 [Bacteroidota bacterium]|jgi:cytochrome c oxidase subunit 2